MKRQIRVAVAFAKCVSKRGELAIRAALLQSKHEGKRAFVIGRLRAGDAIKVHEPLDGTRRPARQGCQRREQLNSELDIDQSMGSARIVSSAPGLPMTCAT